MTQWVLDLAARKVLAAWNAWIASDADIGDEFNALAGTIIELRQAADADEPNKVVQRLEDELEHDNFHGGSWQERCLDSDCPYRSSAPLFPDLPIPYPGKVD